MKNAYGYTVIELLIVITIMAMIMGGVTIGYNSFHNTERLRQAGRILKSDLRKAQTNATSGLKPTSGCTSLSGYRVTFSTSSYTIQASCSNGLAGPVTSVSLPPDTSFFQVPGSVTFKVISGTIDTDVLIRLRSKGKTYSLEVDRSGNITDVGL